MNEDVWRLGIIYYGHNRMGGGTFMWICSSTINNQWKRHKKSSSSVLFLFFSPCGGRDHVINGSDDRKYKRLQNTVVINLRNVPCAPTRANLHERWSGVGMQTGSGWSSWEWDAPLLTLRTTCSLKLVCVHRLAHFGPESLIWSLPPPHQQGALNTDRRSCGWSEDR